MCGVVFFVSKSVLGTERQKNLEKYTIYCFDLNCYNTDKSIMAYFRTSL